VKESFYKLVEDFYRECEQFMYYFDSKSPSASCISQKMGFEKPFDTIQHEPLFQIFRDKGFNEYWIR
jgi:hypothetical protein